MLLALDIGNSSTSIGLFRDTRLMYQSRCKTTRLFFFLLKKRNILSQADAVIVASVVPGKNARLRQLLKTKLDIKKIGFVSHKLRLPIRLPRAYKTAGADRIANDSAAYFRYRSAVLVIDYGTATTMDYIDQKGRYRGGIICPGVEISAKALFNHTAVLKKHASLLRKPKRVVGRKTAEQIQSGLIHGHAAMVDRLIEKVRSEIAARPKIIATGGWARLIVSLMKHRQIVWPHLTLEGLRLLSTLNRA